MRILYGRIAAHVVMICLISSLVIIMGLTIALTSAGNQLCQNQTSVIPRLC